MSKSLSININEIEDILRLTAKEGLTVRINDALYLLKEFYDEMINKLEQFSKTNNEITVSEFRDMIGTTRKYALPFLEYLDINKITIRIGEKRKILIK
ncbi:Translation elongation factor SelB, winged helix, type 3 domain protein [Candidatus Magnetoovum chiemensis]|nr:Translation elongation factor SelB, winged helix, type 3 domain protein [Candidatus Magnetoovum chiemensis]